MILMPSLQNYAFGISKSGPNSWAPSFASLTITRVCTIQTPARDNEEQAPDLRCGMPARLHVVRYNCTLS